VISRLRQVRVLDLSEGVAGPYAATLLADVGAQVVKLERPEKDWGRSLGPGGANGDLTSGFVALNRNKRAITIDLGREEGRSIARRLVGRSDVLISNFRPGVMERLGLGYEDCLKIKPSLIYCTITAFGSEGAYASVPGSDTALQAISGLMSIIGESDGPPLRVGFPIIDVVAALFAVQGILVALLAEEPEEHIGRVEVSLLDAALALQNIPFAKFLWDGEVPLRHGNENPALSPAGAFLTADEEYLIIAVLRESHWTRLCGALGKEDLLHHPDFSSNARRVENRSALNALLEPIFRKRSLHEWMEILRKADVLCAPVNDYRAIIEDESLASAAALVDVQLPRHMIKSMGNPVRLDGSVAGIEISPPAPGEHTEQLLRELSYSEKELQYFLHEGVALSAEASSSAESNAVGGVALSPSDDLQIDEELAP
jgi:crotonobetainyl-CoA:carnitine CoA-transferase CaiB-like acyl-CoA transferase